VAYERVKPTYYPLIINKNNFNTIKGTQYHHLLIFHILISIPNCQFLLSFSYTANCYNYIVLVIEDWMSIEYEWNDSDGKTQRNSCHTATLSTTDPKWSGQGLNLCLLGQKATTNCLDPLQGAWILLMVLKLYSVDSYARFAKMIRIKSLVPCVHKSVGSIPDTVFIAIPLQAWTGPEGPRRLKLPDFKTVGTWRR
jgi:hypothetical protein